MRLYHWQVEVYSGVGEKSYIFDFLMMADTEEGARSLLIEHVRSSNGPFKEELVSELLGRPRFVAAEYYPVVIQNVREKQNAASG